jgi:hypothetical protein
LDSHAPPAPRPGGSGQGYGQSRSPSNNQRHVIRKKSPRPDGFIGAFYKRCWEIIRVDQTAAIREIFNLRAACWNLLNSSKVVLIPKREGAREIIDYRPISIMDSMAKLLCKILVNRLAPHLDRIVSRSQSAFIRGRSIHDNFQYVQGDVNNYHRTKTPTLLVKLDIAKAFDCVWWEYLLELMEQIGSGQRWCNIMALLWSHTSSRILLNSEPGKPIKHGRELRQGDPVSPMLFIIAMDPLQQLLEKATQEGLLTLIGGQPNEDENQPVC